MTSPAARRVQRAFSRAAAGYDAAAGIQRQVATELVSHLPARQAPTNILDLGCGTGFALNLLRSRYPETQLVGIDFSENMLRRVPAMPALQKISANATLLPLTDACADLVISSLTYQWCALDLALGEAARVLRPGATLAFSTLTGETFGELRHAFAGIDDAPHVLPLLPPDAISTAVARAGLTGIRCHRSRHVARFENTRALFESIRQTGASEVARADTPGGRRRGLLGKAAYATIEARLKSLADPQGRLPLTYDVFYVVAHQAVPGSRSTESAALPGNAAAGPT